MSSNQRRNEELNGDFARFRSEHEQLKRNYESLQDDYQQQQQIANDIRTEAANLLEEVKNLNAKNAELLSGKDSDSQKIRDLSSEIERLKHGGAANPGIPASRCTSFFLKTGFVADSKLHSHSTVFSVK